MFFHIPVFFYTLVFILIIELSATDLVGGSFSFFFSRGISVKIFIVSLLFFYFFNFSRKISRKASMAIIPILFVIAVMGLSYFVQPAKQQQLLIALSAFAYYFIHLALYRLHIYEKDKTAHSIIASGGMATIFLIYCTMFAIYLNYNIPLYILMIIMMLITTLVSYQYFSLIREEKKRVFNFSLVLGLIMAEISWALNFWPFGYLTTGVIAFIFYYMFWDLVQCHFAGELSKRRVIANMIFLGFIVGLILSTSRWLPVV